jgi:hypothetical protein
MTVTLPYDPTWKALEWAKEHCPNYITNGIHRDGDNSSNKIDYFFSNEREALMFLLRWS